MKKNKTKIDFIYGISLIKSVPVLDLCKEVNATLKKKMKEFDTLKIK